MRATVVRLGNAVLGEWRGAPRRPAMPASERKVRQLRNECSRLAYLRRSHRLALGEATGWAVVIANVVGGMGKPINGAAINAMAVSFGLPAIDDGIVDAVALDAETARRLWGAGRHNLLGARMVGALLQVTAAEREEAGIRCIDAIDESPSDRRRRLDRSRKAIARAARAAQAGPRLTQAEQAIAEGISLSTWRRRHPDAISVRSPEKEDAPAHVSPARVKKRTQNVSDGGVGHA